MFEEVGSSYWQSSALACDSVNTIVITFVPMLLLATRSHSHMQEQFK